mmetsp:Transcript_58539/g.114995  ORF Transcript_58539/g.114995 Transcript_58539/m.114995 type:complete len:302 (+) Transcript_58539:358-1263(+)
MAAWQNLLQCVSVGANKPHLGSPRVVAVASFVAAASKLHHGSSRRRRRSADPLRPPPAPLTQRPPVFKVFLERAELERASVGYFGHYLKAPGAKRKPQVAETVGRVGVLKVQVLLQPADDSVKHVELQLTRSQPALQQRHRVRVGQEVSAEGNTRLGACHRFQRVRRLQHHRPRPLAGPEPTQKPVHEVAAPLPSPPKVSAEQKVVKGPRGGRKEGKRRKRSPVVIVIIISSSSTIVGVRVRTLLLILLRGGVCCGVNILAKHCIRDSVEQRRQRERQGRQHRSSGEQAEGGRSVGAVAVV